MKLEMGQRWRFRKTGLIIEIWNLESGDCIVKTGDGTYSVGIIGDWVSNLQRGFGYWEYLENQDAPM